MRYKKSLCRLAVVLLLLSLLTGIFIIPVIADGTGGKIYKTVIQYSQSGTRTDELPEGSDVDAYIAEKKSKFISAVFGSGNAVSTDAYEELFTENTYADFAGMEFTGTSYNYSDDLIYIGDIDNFDNAYIVSGTATCEKHYRVLYILVTVNIKENEPEPLRTPGDINGDGHTDNKDVVTLFRYLSGYGETVVTAALDCSGDGLSDNKDVTVLFRYVSTNGNSFISDKPFIKS